MVWSKDGSFLLRSSNLGRADGRCMMRNSRVACSMSWLQPITITISHDPTPSKSVPLLQTSLRGEGNCKSPGLGRTYESRPEIPMIDRHRLRPQPARYSQHPRGRTPLLMSIVHGNFINIFVGHGLEMWHAFHCTLLPTTSIQHCQGSRKSQGPSPPHHTISPFEYTRHLVKDDRQNSMSGM